MDLVIRTPDELLAAVPHLLGFKPEESLVLVPFGPGLPTVRVDLPTSAEGRDGVWEALRGPIGQHARPGAQVGIICVTKDQRSAELASQHLATRLESIGITARIRLCSDGARWKEFNTGSTGLQTQATTERVAAKTVLAGVAQPASSRASLAASLVGDREPIAQLIPAARVAAAASSPAVERDWALDRLERFHVDGNRLSDVDGARMLVALKTISTRDALWMDMTKDNYASHAAMWSDLTRRAPDEVRAAPASLLGFASWQCGDGAKAWSALEQVPADQPYSLANLIGAALQAGIHPREWERYQTQLRNLVSEPDESFVPTPTERQRDVPSSSPAADRPAPGR